MHLKNNLSITPPRINLPEYGVKGESRSQFIIPRVVKNFTETVVVR